MGIWKAVDVLLAVGALKANNADPVSYVFSNIQTITSITFVYSDDTNDHHDFDEHDV